MLAAHHGFGSSPLPDGTSRSLLAGLFLVTALRLWLVDIPNLLYSTTGPLVGASYTDLHASLPALRISAFVALLAAATVLFGAMRRELGRYALLAVGGYMALAMWAGTRARIHAEVRGGADGADPRDAVPASPHQRRRAQAWGLDSVETRELTGEANLTLADIRANAPTIENVRLWDREPLLQTFGQLQEIRTYYDFVSVDDDRYWMDGKYRQVLLSPRELNAARSRPGRSSTSTSPSLTGWDSPWVRSTRSRSRDLPVLFMKDLPPASTVSLKVTRPQIYYGELANEFVFVGTRQREFDYPSGEANVYASYKGKGGVDVGSLLSAARSARPTSARPKSLFSGDITERKPGAVLPEHRGAGAQGAAVPAYSIATRTW